MSEPTPGIDPTLDLIQSTIGDLRKARESLRLQLNGVENQIFVLERLVKTATEPPPEPEWVDGTQPDVPDDGTTRV